MKRILFLLIFSMFILSSCEDTKQKTTAVKSTSKTVSDIMKEANVNHGGNVQNPNDEKTKNIQKQAAVVNIPNGSNINGGSNLKKSKSDKTINLSDIDVDLTRLSSTMVYSEVFNMMNEPEKYVGKMVRMNGNLAVYKYPERNYYTCIIKDATACCQQGMEFVWKGNHKFPDDYPKEGAGIIVTGIFDIYYEGENKYCQLKDASLVKDRA